MADIVPAKTLELEVVADLKPIQGVKKNRCAIDLHFQEPLAIQHKRLKDWEDYVQSLSFWESSNACHAYKYRLGLSFQRDIIKALRGHKPAPVAITFPDSYKAWSSLCVVSFVNIAARTRYEAQLAADSLMESCAQLLVRPGLTPLNFVIEWPQAND
jgi:hypothetical protein